MAEKKTAAEADDAQKKAPARKASAAKSEPVEKPAKAEKAATAEKATTAKATTAKATTAKAEKAEAPAKAEKPAKATTAKASSTKAASSSAKSAASAPTNVREGQGGTLRVHHLRPAPGAHTPKTRVGRGEASKGKTAGRGTKGTKARQQVPASREGGGIPLHMRLPKLRGFKNPFRTTYQVVNLDRLAELYPDGGAVTGADLVAKGAVRKGAPVKVLGDGDIAVKLDVSVEAVSRAAREKILAAGGSVQD